MGTQTATAERIRKKHGDYVLAVKENQGTLYEEIKLYFEEKHLEKIVKKGNYLKKQRKITVRQIQENTIRLLLSAGSAEKKNGKDSEQLVWQSELIGV